jgi:hypothetical protein
MMVLRTVLVASTAQALVSVVKLLVADTICCLNRQCNPGIKAREEIRYRSFVASGARIAIDFIHVVQRMPLKGFMFVLFGQWSVSKFDG